MTAAMSATSTHRSMKLPRDTCQSRSQRSPMIVVKMLDIKVVWKSGWKIRHDAASSIVQSTIIFVLLVQYPQVRLNTPAHC